MSSATVNSLEEIKTGISNGSITLPPLDRGDNNDPLLVICAQLCQQHGGSKDDAEVAQTILSAFQEALSDDPVSLRPMRMLGLESALTVKLTARGSGKDYFLDRPDIDPDGTAIMITDDNLQCEFFGWNDDLKSWVYAAGEMDSNAFNGQLDADHPADPERLLELQKEVLSLQWRVLVPVE